jgi:acyl-CoA dehydrogenase
MSNDYESSDVELFRDNVRRFLAEHIAPDYQQWENAGITPRDLWNKLGEAGFLCVDVPEEHGGSGAPFIFSMALLEEFGRAGFPSVSGGMAVHSDVVAHYLVNCGSDQQRQHYLPKMATGELVGAIAMTEPGAGSDLQSIITSAQEDGDDYIINGSKTFITNGQHCDFVVVAARTNKAVAGAKGTSLFIVDCSNPGFQRGRNLEKIGLHAADTSELFFTEMRVPKSAMLGQPDRGFVVLMSELQRERLSLGFIAVSAAEGTLALTIDYVKERKAFGKPLGDLQNTRFRLAEMQMDVRLHRAFVNECLASYEKGELDVGSVSMVKLGCTEMQGRVADGCLQMFGGYGYMAEYPVSRAYTDARAQRIYGGTSEIMKELISREILR